MCQKDGKDLGGWSRPSQWGEVAGEVRKVMGDKIIQGLGRLRCLINLVLYEEHCSFEQRSHVVG